jgi:tetraacyldisaccharide 4'-kinase
VLASRNAKFDSGRGVVTFDRPVISIGNLTVGGTGKTPMVSWLVAKLRSAGHDPCIAMRGYKSVHGMSDEAVECAARFSDLPIVAQPNRIEGLIRLFGGERGERVDTIVLDDGFQHRQIARQANIVLIDARWNLDEAKLLPHGWYREGVEALKRVDAVVLMHADRVSPSDLAAQQARVKQWTSAPVAAASHAWRCVDLFGPGDKVLQSTEAMWVKGKRLAVIAAIARPEQFIAQVEQMSGQKVAESVVLGDHAAIPLDAISRLARSGVDGVVMTGKDWA